MTTTLLMSDLQEASVSHAMATDKSLKPWHPAEKPFTTPSSKTLNFSCAPTSFKEDTCLFNHEKSGKIMKVIQQIPSMRTFHKDRAPLPLIRPKGSAFDGSFSYFPCFLAPLPRYILLKQTSRCRY